MNSAAISAQPIASPHAHGGNSVTRTMSRVHFKRSWSNARSEPSYYFTSFLPFIKKG